MNAGARAEGEGEYPQEAVRRMVHVISNLSTEKTPNNLPHSLTRSKTLIGLSRFVTCACEVPMFWIAGTMMKRMGTSGVLCFACFCYTARFLSYASLYNPQHVLWIAIQNSGLGVFGSLPPPPTFPIAWCWLPLPPNPTTATNDCFVPSESAIGRPSF